MTVRNRTRGGVAAALVAALLCPVLAQDGPSVPERTRSRYAETAATQPGESLILFTRDGGLFAMRADGTEVERIATRAVECTNASWSPDGRQIVFAGDVEGEGRGVFVVGADGEGLRKVASLRCRFPMQPVWSPRPTLDGTHVIVFSDAVGEGEHDYDLFAVRPDGTQGRNLTRTPDVRETYPTWSPDATRVAFVGERQIDVRRRRRGPWIAGRRTETEPKWVKDVFVARLVSDADGLLLVEGENVTANGSPELAFDARTGESHHFEGLTWARTRERLAVVVVEAPRTACSDVWIIDLTNASRTRNVTRSRFTSEVAVRWSPDDTHLLFARIDVDGSQEGVCLLPSLRRGKPTMIPGSADLCPADWQRVSIPVPRTESPDIEVQIRPPQPPR